MCGGTSEPWSAHRPPRSLREICFSKGTNARLSQEAPEPVTCQDALHSLSLHTQCSQYSSVESLLFPYVPLTTPCLEPTCYFMICMRSVEHTHSFRLAAWHIVVVDVATGMMMSVMLMLALQSSLAQTRGWDGEKGATKSKSGINWKYGAKTIWHLRRFKLQAAFCPTASEEEKQSLPCKFYDIARNMRTAKSAMAKVKLVAIRSKMFEAEESKPAEEKKAVQAQIKALYTKAWAVYCTDAHKDESVCTRDSMKSLYGPKSAA